MTLLSLSDSNAFKNMINSMSYVSVISSDLWKSNNIVNYVIYGLSYVLNDGAVSLVHRFVDADNILFRLLNSLFEVQV